METNQADRVTCWWLIQIGFYRNTDAVLRHWRKTTTLCHYFLCLPGLCDTLLKSIPANLSAKYGARVPAGGFILSLGGKNICKGVDFQKATTVYFCLRIPGPGCRAGLCLSVWGGSRVRMGEDGRVIYPWHQIDVWRRDKRPSIKWNSPPRARLSKPAEVVMVWGAKGDNSWAEITPEQRKNHQNVQFHLGFFLSPPSHWNFSSLLTSKNLPCSPRNLLTKLGS